MKTSFYSIATDRSNNLGLQKMNVHGEFIWINQPKVITKYYDMCPSTSSVAVGIFTAIDTALMKNSITWDKCVSLAVINTSVNVGRNNFVIVEARKKNKSIILTNCPCDTAHNAASKATKAFVKVVNNFDVEELLVDICFVCWVLWSAILQNH